MIRRQVQIPCAAQTPPENLLKDSPAAFEAELQGFA
jgi:hypothetical protein